MVALCELLEGHVCALTAEKKPLDCLHGAKQMVTLAQRPGLLRIADPSALERQKLTGKLSKTHYFTKARLTKCQLLDTEGLNQAGWNCRLLDRFRYSNAQISHATYDQNAARCVMVTLLER